MMRLPLLAAILGLALLPATGALSAERPVVVELFTSQGCSSCPPADAYLTELARGRRDVLPLAFHVTYWNRLGWRDPFSLEAATERQDGYAQRFGDNAFTPQMVIDGTRSVVGSRRGEVAAAIGQAAPGARAAAAAMRLRREGGRISVTVGPGQGSGRVLLVGFDREHTTAVARGENGGRTLTESNIVRSIRNVGQWSGGALSLSEPAPAGGDAAVILQAPDGRILGAARLGETS